MKFIGNIICSIAILTQIILSTGLLSHAPECRSSQSVSTEVASDAHNGCGCGHYHVTVPATNDDLCDANPIPSHDCTCIPQNTYPYVLGDHIAELKSKEHILDAISMASTDASLPQLSQLLCKSNQSNAPPSQTDYLQQHDARFTSIHLGVFLI